MPILIPTPFPASYQALPTPAVPTVGYTLPSTGDAAYTLVPQQGGTLNNLSSGSDGIPSVTLNNLADLLHNNPESLPENPEFAMPESFLPTFPSPSFRSPVLVSGDGSMTVFDGLISLQTLPAAAHPQLFEDFQDAADSGDLSFLDDTVRGWQTTASLYARPELTTAIANDLSGFAVVHSRLLILLVDDEENDEQVKPTGYAYNTALRLLLETQQNIGILPKAAVTTDDEGGVRVQWIRPDRGVRLIIPANPDEKHYIYYEVDDNYDAEDYDPNTASSTLAHFLIAASIQ